MFSPSTATMASVTFSIRARFWSGVNTPPMTWISTSGICLSPVRGWAGRAASWSSLRLCRLGRAPPGQAGYHPPGTVQQEIDADHQAEDPQAAERPFSQDDEARKDSDDAR